VWIVIKVNDVEMNLSALPKRVRRSLGIGALLLTVCIWVASSTVIQYVFLDLNYDAPFFVTYLSTTMFSLYLTGFVLPSWRTSHKLTTVTPDALPMLSPWQVFKIAIKFCPLWTAGNWSFNAALSLTSVSSNTILSSTSGMWTFLLGMLLLKDKFSWKKLCAVLVTFGGVCLVAVADEEADGQETLLGDALALLGACCYGLYTTFLRREIPDERLIRMPMFFGFVGIFNVFILWPMFPILDAIGIEKWWWPSQQVWLFLTLNALIGTMVSELCWALAVLLTSPLVATVGLSLSIPLALLSDTVFRKLAFSWAYFVGSALVIAGFMIVNLVKDAKPASVSLTEPVEPPGREEEIVPLRMAVDEN
jgi:solute carrier family 35 protein F5